MAVDYYRPGGSGGLFAAWGLAAGRSLWRQSAARLRDGTARLSATCVARRDGSCISCGVYVDAGNAAQLGRFIPGERPLPAIPGPGQDGKTLRRDWPAVYDFDGVDQRLCGRAVALGRRGLADCAWPGRRDRCSVYPALVL